ncbi:MAG TPA: hypothetical protein VJ870_20780 [Amycolatopsis sp.]|nr:hypothetical protein [Amycolatopsis sp.]
MLDTGLMLNLGLVNEVLPRDALLDRTWELATQVAARPRLVVRDTRVMLTESLRQPDAVEGLAVAADAPR